MKDCWQTCSTSVIPGGYLMGVVWVVFVTLKDTPGLCNGKQKEILYISVVWFKRNVLFYNFK